MPSSRYVLVRWTISVVLATLVCLVSASAHAETVKCQRAIAKEAVKFLKAKVNILQKCRDRVHKGTPGPCPDTKGAAKLNTARAKLADKIAAACGGTDDVCGGAADDAAAALGWPSACPDFESAGCGSVAIGPGCEGIAECIRCTHELAGDQAIALYYDDLANPGANNTLRTCQLTIGKETAKFLFKKDKALLKCWDAKLKAKHAGQCDFVSPGDGKYIDKIATAELKKIDKICKKCGGPDKLCNDVGDLAPAAIGFRDECPDVTLPLAPGTACGGPVSTLSDLVSCVDCVTEFKVDCVTAVRVPEFQAFPGACTAAAATAVCGDDVREEPEDCDGTDDVECPTQCGSSCTCPPVCGNGQVDGGEACDGDSDAACPGGCLPTCACDTFCGDGVQTFDELCDDGNAVDGDGCDTNCTVTGCGNEVLTGSEACDDGNNTAGDCCSAACTFETAGAACSSDGEPSTADSCDGAGTCLHAITFTPPDCSAASTIDSFNSSLPDIPIPPPADSDLAQDDRFDGTGLLMSRTRILVVFTDDATEFDVCMLLNSISGRIIGTIPEIDLTLVAIPSSSSFAPLESALATLQGDSSVGLAVEDVALGPLRISPPTAAQGPSMIHSANVPAGQNPNPWIWTVPPSNGAGAAGADGNWGLEAVRAAQMWNLHDFAARKAAARPLASTIRNGVLDVGFDDVNSDGINDHQDMRTRLQTWRRVGNAFRAGASPESHGQHVAGIMGARFNDASGVEGINPFAEAHATGDGHFVGVSITAAARAGGPIEARRAALFAPILGDLRSMLGNWPDLRVVNISLGYNWAAVTRNLPLGPFNPNTRAAIQRVVSSQGSLVRAMLLFHPNVLVVPAAGNDSHSVFGYPTEIHAQWASPFTFAALGEITVIVIVPLLPSPNVLVVESDDAVVVNNAVPPYRWQYAKSDFSNTGGHVSAPGGRVMSSTGTNLPDRALGGFHATHPLFYPAEDTFDGTSMAAPHVAGLLGYLLNLDDALTRANLVDFFRGPNRAAYTRLAVFRAGEQPLPPPPTVTPTAATPTPTGVTPTRTGPMPTPTARPMMDAFAVTMGIDAVRANQTIQRALVDVDDGSLDGNARFDRDDDDVDGNYLDQFGIGYADRRRGNGTIDMKDFRPYRDALVQVLAGGALPLAQVRLDHGPRHFKKDLNFDGCIANRAANPRPPSPGSVPRLTDGQCANAPLETVYPRYDFNGSGTLEPEGRLVAPPAAGVAPFKIDPDTSCTGLNAPIAGCVRDLDVVADPGIWSQDDENVSITAADEGTNACTPGSCPINQWFPTRYLLGDRDADGTIDYPLSADLHFRLRGEIVAAITWTIEIASYTDATTVGWSRIADVTETFSNKIVTVPLFAARKIRVTVSAFGPVFFDKTFTGVRYGEDCVLRPATNTATCGTP